MKTLFLSENLEYRIITSHIDKINKYSIIISSITEEEELDLDNNKAITIKRGNKTFNIQPNNIECYGVIDFHNSSDDMDIIADFNWLNHLTFGGVVVPSNYDYERHCVQTPLNIPLVYDTFRPEVVAQYAHGLIGKPERSIIFKHNWKK